MSYDFDLNIGDLIKYSFFGNLEHIGTIMGTDVNDDASEGYYLVLSSSGSEDYNQIMLSTFEGGDFKCAQNLPKDGRYHWVNPENVKHVLAFSYQEPKKKNNKKESSQDFGRWLSGIDQYSDDNYSRGNSGFKWL